jgi:probable rRNA maturation factor
MLTFTINDPHKKINISLKHKMSRINKLIGCPIRKSLFYDVSIVNDYEIKQINHQYRKINKPTDVISFAFYDSNSVKTPLLGEIFINYQQARRQTKINYEYEILLLFTHGVLHLIGYDHHNKKTEKQMFELQNKIMQELNLIR